MIALRTLADNPNQGTIRIANDFICNKTAGTTETKKTYLQ